MDTSVIYKTLPRNEQIKKNKKYQMLHFGDLNKTHFIRFMRRDTIHFGQAACPLSILTKYGAKVFKIKQFSM